MRRFLQFIAAALLAGTVYAQAETTTINGVVYLANGTPAPGGKVTATLSISGQVTVAGAGQIVVGKVADDLDANGAWSLALIPNDIITPTGTYYSVEIRATGAATITQKWQVPSSPDPGDVGDLTIIDSPPGIVIGPYVRVIDASPDGQPCQPGDYPAFVTDGSGEICLCTAGIAECSGFVADGDDQTAPQVPYTPTTGASWVDPDPTQTGGALDALAARLTTEEAKADDDVPESGDFAALTGASTVTFTGDVTGSSFGATKTATTACIANDGADRLYHDTDCDDVKDGGEEYLDQIGGGAGVTDGDKGDINVSLGGTAWNVDPDSIEIGTDTTGPYAASATEAGVATSALVLASDPPDCALGQWSAGINASGVAQGCTPDDDLPEAVDFANLTAGTGITRTTGTLDFAPAELDSFTWGTSALPSFAHTFDVSTGTNPVVTYGDNNVDVSTPVSATQFTADVGADGENGVSMAANATTGKNPGASQVAVSWVTGTGLGIRTASGGAFRKIWHTDAGSLGSLALCSAGLCTLLDSTVGTTAILDGSIGVADLNAAPTPQFGESYYVEVVTGQTGFLLRELNDVRNDIGAAHDQDSFWTFAADGYTNGKVVNSLATLNTVIGASIANGPHTTSASDLTSGTLAAARLGSAYIDALSDFASLGCISGQLLKYNGSSWSCAGDTGNTSALVNETITSPTSSMDRILFQATEPTLLSGLSVALQGTTSVTWDLVYARDANASTVGEVIGTDTVTSSATGTTVSMNAPTIPAGAWVRAKASAASGTPSGLFLQFSTVVTTSTQCNNGTDDADGEDSLIDYPADPGCASATDTDETNTDSTAPEAITVAGHSFNCNTATTTTIDLDWNAPHEDGASGGAVSGYDCRRRAGSTFVEGDWAGATTLTGEPSPGSPGAAQGFTVTGLSGGTQYAFACKSTDEVPNTSAISDAVTCTTVSLGNVYTEDWSVTSADCNLGTCTTPGQVNNTWTAYSAGALLVEAANNWLDQTGSADTWSTALTTEVSADESQIGWLCLATGTEDTKGFYTLLMRSASGTGWRLAINSQQASSGTFFVEEWTGSGPTGPFTTLGTLGGNKITPGNCGWAWLEGTGSATVMRFWLNEAAAPSSTDPTTWGNADWCLSDTCPGSPPSQCAIDCDDFSAIPQTGTDNGRRGGIGIYNETGADADQRISSWGFGDPGGD